MNAAHAGIRTELKLDEFLEKRCKTKKAVCRYLNSGIKSQNRITKGVNKGQQRERPTGLKVGCAYTPGKGGQYKSGAKPGKYFKVKAGQCVVRRKPRTKSAKVKAWAALVRKHTQAAALEGVSTEERKENFAAAVKAAAAEKGGSAKKRKSKSRK